MTHWKAKQAEDSPWGLEGVQKDPNKVYKYANRKKPASNDQSGSTTNRPPPEKKPNLDKVQSLHGTCNPYWVWITNRFYKQNDDQPMKNQIVMIHQIPQSPVSNVTQISKGTIISSSNNSVLPPSSWNRPIKFAPGIQRPINDPWFAHLILVQLSTWPGILAPFSNDRSAVVHGSLNLTVLTYFWLSSQSFILIGRLV